MLDIVSCCTESGRDVSVDFGAWESDKSFSRRQVIPVDCHILAEALVCLKALLSLSLAWFAVEPCPNLVFTTRYEGQVEKLLQS